MEGGGTAQAAGGAVGVEAWRQGSLPVHQLCGLRGGADCCEEGEGEKDEEEQEERREAGCDVVYGVTECDVVCSVTSVAECGV